MSDYEKLANEYRHSADVTMAKIRELEAMRRYGHTTPQDERRLLILYEMHGDCMLCYRELMKKSRKIRRCE